MHPLALALLQTAGIIALAFAAAWAGRRLATARLWAWAVAVPLALVAAIALPRWIPELILVWPFRLFMQDRLLFVVMAVVAPVLMATLAFRLARPREKRAVLAFLCVFAVYFCVLPFAGPALAWNELSGLKTRVDADGVCRQTTDYTCGPAAAVTVLDRLGVAADESPLAVAAHTNTFFGTLCGDLGAAMGGPGRRFHTRCFADARGLVGHTPCVAVVKYNFLVDHFVAVLEADETGVVIGDPIAGKQALTHAEFAQRWRKVAVVREE